MVPGSPEDTLVPFSDDDPRAAPVREEIREENHLDRSLFIQYRYWLGDFVQGDFGDYYHTSGTFPVGDRASDALPASLQLMVYSPVPALVVATPLGAFGAYGAGAVAARRTRPTPPPASGVPP